MLAKTYFITSSILNLHIIEELAETLKLMEIHVFQLFFWKYYVIDNLYDMYYKKVIVHVS